MAGRRYYSQQYSLVDNPQATHAAEAEISSYNLYDHEQETTSYPNHQYNDREAQPSQSYPPAFELQTDTSYDPRAPSYHSSTPAYHSPSPALQPPPAFSSNFDEHDDGLNKLPPRPTGRSRGIAGWSRRRKFIIFGSIAAGIVIVAAAIGIAIGITRANAFSYTPSYAQVNQTLAFSSGGATHNDPWTTTSDGIGAGTNKYTYYSGDAASFPNQTSWVSFDDMWTNNLPTLQTSCKTLKAGANNSPAMISDIYTAIQNRAAASLVDHRFIFAIILQESAGCARVGGTTSSTGVRNPGLMQSHDGHSYNAAHSNTSILAMVQDGTQGTSSDAGYGLVQNLNLYMNPYKAARGYNSGYIPSSGNLSEAAGATACYVSDVANRLLGWTNATSTCPGGASTK